MFDPKLREMAIGTVKEYKRLANEAAFKDVQYADIPKANFLASLGILRALTELLENPRD